MRSYEFVMMKTEVHNIEFTKKWRGGSSLVRGGVVFGDCGAHRLALPRQAQDMVRPRNAQSREVA